MFARSPLFSPDGSHAVPGITFADLNRPAARLSLSDKLQQMVLRLDLADNLLVLQGKEAALIELPWRAIDASKAADSLIEAQRQLATLLAAGRLALSSGNFQVLMPFLAWISDAQLSTETVQFVANGLGIIRPDLGVAPITWPREGVMSCLSGLFWVTAEQGQPGCSVFSLHGFLREREPSWASESLLLCAFLGEARLFGYVEVLPDELASNPSEGSVRAGGDSSRRESRYQLSPEGAKIVAAYAASARRYLLRG